MRYCLVVITRYKDNNLYECDTKSLYTDTVCVRVNMSHDMVCRTNEIKSRTRTLQRDNLW